MKDPHRADAVRPSYTGNLKLSIINSVNRWVVGEFPSNLIHRGSDPGADVEHMSIRGEKKPPYLKTGRRGGEICYWTTGDSDFACNGHNVREPGRKVSGLCQAA